MEALCSSETPVDTQRTTRRYIPEDDTLHNHRCENLKSYKKHENKLTNKQTIGLIVRSEGPTAVTMGLSSEIWHHIVW
jgi:hypothetical protein